MSDPITLSSGGLEGLKQQEKTKQKGWRVCRLCIYKNDMLKCAVMKYPITVGDDATFLLIVLTLLGKMLQHNPIYRFFCH